MRRGRILYALVDYSKQFHDNVGYFCACTVYSEILAVALINEYRGNTAAV